jgi:NAD+ synthase
MNRIDYIVNWIKEYANNNQRKSLVVGISGGIDSAVVSTLCAKTGLPTHRP